MLLTETTGLEETAVPEVVRELEKLLEVGRGDVGTALLEEEGIVAVLLGDTGMLMLVVVGLGLLEAGAVVVFTGEGSTVAVVVYMSKSVPKMVPSL